MKQRGIIHPGILLTGALLIAPVCFGAERVLSVGNQTVTVTTNSRDNQWATSDSVCLYQARKAVACGDVERVGDGDMEIRTEQSAPRVAVGERVFVRPNVRHPASSSATEVFENSDSRKYIDVSFGVAVGPTYYYPEAHLQLALSKDISIGIMPMFVDYTNDSTQVKAWGGFATLNYYYTHSTFRGLFFQAAGGFYSIQNTTTTATSQLSPAAAMGTVQWRGKALWGLGMDIGVGAGAQYVFGDGIAPTSNFRGLLPVLTAYLGYSF